MDSANKDLSHSLSNLNSNQLTLCQYRICPECGNDHGFRGDFDDTVTSIDTLPQIFPVLFKTHNGSIRNVTSRLQGFVN